VGVAEVVIATVCDLPSSGMSTQARQRCEAQPWMTIELRPWLISLSALLAMNKPRITPPAAAHRCRALDRVDQLNALKRQFGCHPARSSL
jgi:hypothetical protein